MRRVIIESPYAVGSITYNLSYLRVVMRDCVLRGESPYASHGLLTQDGVLDDEVAPQRKLGIEAGFAWHAVAEMMVVACDLGVTAGMRAGIASARSLGLAIEYRSYASWATNKWDASRRGSTCPECNAGAYLVCFEPDGAALLQSHSARYEGER